MISGVVGEETMKTHSLVFFTDWHTRELEVESSRVGSLIESRFECTVVICKQEIPDQISRETR